MPRKSSISSRRSSPTRNATYAQAPLRQSTQAPPATGSGQKGGMFSGLGGVLAQGMAFGAGSEIAHQAIRGVMGGNSTHQPVVVNQQPSQAYDQSQQQLNKCQYENNQFIDCLKSNGDALGSCQSFFDMLKSCEKQYS